jgi:hypothetical protein
VKPCSVTEARLSITVEVGSDHGQIEAWKRVEAAAEVGDSQITARKRRRMIARDERFQVQSFSVAEA